MRVLILSDIHSNLEAFEACLAAAPPHDVVANLGDIVGYGASPNEVIERSRSLGKTFVRGNHDKAACGLMDIQDFNPVAAMAALWTRENLTPENLQWLRALPQGPVQIEGIPEAQFVHGSPVDEDEYVVTLRDAIKPLSISAAPLSFFGHTHLQGTFSDGHSNTDVFRPMYRTVGQSETVDFPLQANQRYLVNPGSVGQPRDGDWRAGFAVYDSESRIVTFCRVPYNLKRSQELILEANLPPRLASRLATGR